MKRGTPDHPKTLALMEALACPRPMAVGVLELLWHFTARYAPQGDIGRWSDANIAAGVCWPGDPAALVLALVRAGWLDESPKHRLVVHDWHDHADDAAKKHIQRNNLQFATCPKRRLSCVATSRDKSRNVTPAVAVAVAVAKPERTGAPTRPEPVIVDALTGERRPLFTPSTWIETEAEWRARVSESLKLAQQAGAMHGTDPPDEIARAADYPGAKGRKVDPRAMSHNRLLNTIAALRKRVGQTADSEPEVFDAFKRAGLA